MYIFLKYHIRFFTQSHAHKIKNHIKNSKIYNTQKHYHINF